MTLENRLYAAKEAATLLSCSAKTVYNYIQAGQLKGINRAGRWYIDADELKAFMERGTEKGYWKQYQAERKEG